MLKPRRARRPRAGRAIALVAALAAAGVGGARVGRAISAPPATTPIQHVVVIFQEDVSFDHYFATYPRAANAAGEPVWKGSRLGGYAPAVNGLSDVLVSHNPNLAAPFRFGRGESYTCGQIHEYTAEQEAADLGAMDRFVETLGDSLASCADYGRGKKLTMGYYDGNTVGALWSWAQHYALADNFFATTYGPSTVGALNLVSGKGGPVDLQHVAGDLSGDVVGTTVIGEPEPYWDDCSGRGVVDQVAIAGRNVGDLLNAAYITWGWFQGGFTPTSTAADGTAVCGSTSANLGGAQQADYGAKYEPFQYFKQTANPHHLAPSAPAMIGRSDQANHQYDLSSFWAAAKAGNLPQVSFLKAKRSQDGHAGYSSPLDEQAWLAATVNQLQQLQEWKTMAIFIAWDDSDGWYDHVLGPIVNPSSTPADALSGAGSCGAGTPLGGVQGRCGYGPRLPLLAISPYSKVNFVDHTLADQTSILRFIEDNWGLGRLGGGSFDEIAGPLNNLFDFGRGPRAGTLVVDPASGEVKAAAGFLALDAAGGDPR
jgi:phospholipase C